MYRFFYIFIFLLFLKTSLIAQTELADSLKRILKNNIPIENEIEALVALSDFYVNKDIELSYNYAQEITKKSKKINNTYLNGLAKLSMANIYRHTNRIQEGIKFAKEGLEIGHKINNKKLKIESLKILGGIYMMLDNKSLALNFYLQILESSDEATLKLSSGVNQLIASLYSDQKKYDKALFYLEKDLKLHTKNKKVEKGGTWSEIGNVYYRQKKYDQALQYYLKAREEGEYMKNIYTLIYATNNIGLVKFRQKKYDEAVKYYEETLEYAQKGENYRHKSNTLSNLAQLYLEKEEYEKSIMYGKKGLEIAIKIKDIVLIIEISKVFTNLYEKINDKESKYFYQELKYKYQDSLMLSKDEKELAALEFHQKMIIKEKENTILAQQNQYLYIYVVLSIVVGILLAIIAFLYFKRNKLKKEVIAQHDKIMTDLQHNRELERKLNQSEQMRLQQKTDFQARQMTGQAVLLMQKNEWLVQIENKLKSLESSTPLEQKRGIKRIFLEIKEAINLEDEWEKYRKQFEEVHPTFFINIQKRFPKSTPNDLRLVAYIKMNLSNKEISQITNITSGSLKVAFNRLKKKFNLSEEDSLRDFIREF